MVIGYILVLIAVIANWRSPLMLFLSSMVAATYITPVHLLGLTQGEFYALCISIEVSLTLLAGVMAHALRARRTDSLACTGAATTASMMGLCHVLAYCYDGFHANSPYRWLMPSLEYLQLLCCITFSPLAVELFEWLSGKLRYNNANFHRSRHGPNLD